jgi:hypothetical protein
MTERRVPPGAPGGAIVGRIPEAFAAVANEKNPRLRDGRYRSLDRGTARDVILCRGNDGAKSLPL